MAERDFSRPIVYHVDGMRDVRVQRDIVYKRDGGAELKMNIYSGARLSGDARAPAVFFVHGGPIPEQFVPPTQWGVFTSYGELAAASALVGVTFNHRLYTPTDYARSQADVAAAIDYVREHAAQLNVDAERIALWYFSGAGPLLGAVLRERPSYVRCVLAFYALLDVGHRVAAKGGGLPMFVARAGLDQPMINQSIDTFVQEALAGNAPLELMNHPAGRHGFDILDDDERSREIIARAVAFAQVHVRRSDR
ncbi:MAG TPA: dienelactone hydrolase family protein [Steroidobacteraceae bacterium]|jgi:Esterase/lipase|nr:dienelactone hydrolase family protein [Steroidobacteraceae bacterium]